MGGCHERYVGEARRMSALEVRRLVLTIVTVVEHWRDCDVILPIFNDTGEWQVVSPSYSGGRLS